MTYNRCLLPILLPLGLSAACAQPYVIPDEDYGDAVDMGDDDPLDDPVDDPIDPVEEVGFTADEGDWVTLTESMLEDNCGMGDWVTDGPGGTVQVVGEQDAAFSITHTRGTELCDLFEDGSYVCDPRSRVDDTPRQEYGVDADLVMDITASGVFHDDETMRWQSYIEVDCHGGGCFIVSLATSSFPCTMTIEVEAESM